MKRSRLTRLGINRCDTCSVRRGCFRHLSNSLVWRQQWQHCKTRQHNIPLSIDARENIHHSQTHGYAQANLLSPSHLQLSHDQPRERGKHEIHNDVVNIPPFLEVLAEVPIDAEIQAPGVLVAVLVADLRPLEEDLQEHEEVHGDDAEPEDPSLPGVGDAEERHAKGRFGPGLPDERPAGGDVDEDAHVLIPFFRRVFEYITVPELPDD